MIDTLISRKAVIKAVDRHTREDGTLDDDISIILEEVKTAFDKEKVIEELNNLKDNLIDCNDLCGECVEIECDQCALEKAIEIVEKGGIE